MPNSEMAIQNKRRWRTWRLDLLGVKQNAQLRQLYNQLLRDTQVECARVEQLESELAAASSGSAELRDAIAVLRQELESQTAQYPDLEGGYYRLQSQAERQRESAELEHYRAVEAELEVARSARLRDESEVECSPLDEHHKGGGSREDEGGLDRHGVIVGDPTLPLAVSSADANYRWDGSPALPTPTIGDSFWTTTSHTGREPRPTQVESLTTAVLSSAALLAQQLPPLQKLSGELQGLTTEGETFQDWRDQFEMVANVCRWDSQTKLVNLVTRLRGQAYAFYGSCTTATRSNHDDLGFVGTVHPCPHTGWAE